MTTPENQPEDDRKRRMHRRLLVSLRPYKERMSVAIASMMLFGARGGANERLHHHQFHDPSSA